MKYIDAEKLIERLEEMKQAEYENCGGVNSKTGTLQEVQELITSLQQEQSELPGIGASGIPGKGFIPVEWVDACEMYGKWKIVRVEQVEVDLEKELEIWRHKHFNGERDEHYSGEYLTRESQLDLARHFYELGLNARKE